MLRRQKGHNLPRAEGSHSGLVRTLGKRVYRKVSRVRISHPPLWAKNQFGFFKKRTASRTKCRATRVAMKHINIEIKAKSVNHDKIRDILVSRNADFKGVDHQIDTYFKVNHGKLKLREGNIENHLIYYDREKIEGPKQSEIILFKSAPESSLKPILVHSCGVLVVVDKKREIFFIDNVKFHIDTVQNLGTFIEIEAIDENGTIGKEKLLKQCSEYLELFTIPEHDLLAVSYSDLLIEKAKQ